MKGKRSAIFILFFNLFIAVLLSGPVTNAWADDEWSDLFENEHKIFGSEKEEKYPVNAFFLEHEDWQDHHSWMVLGLYKSIDYPLFTSTRFLPFFYTLQSKIDNRAKTIWLFPYPYYKKIDHDSRTVVDIFGYSQTTSYSKDSSLLYLWYSGSNQHENSSYVTLFPLFYRSRTDNSSLKAYSLVTPLFWYQSRTDLYADNRGKRESSSVVSLLYKKETTNVYQDQKLVHETETKFLPIVPFLYYSHYEKGIGSHKNMLVLLDWSTNDEGTLQRFWSPAAFWKKNHYLHIPLALSFNWSSSGHDYRINPLFYSHKDPSSSTLGIPVIPFLWYAHENTSYSSKTLLGLCNWKQDSQGSMERILNPFFLWEKDRYWHVPLLLTFNWQKDQANYRVNPLFFSIRDSDSKTAGFPVIPFLWYEHEDATSHRKTLFSLVSWDTGDKKQFSFTFFPLFWYKQESYFILFPLYYSRSNNNEGHIAGRSFSPLHYHRWSDEKDMFWLGPYFSYNNKKKDTSTTFLLPVYYSWHSSASEGSISPLSVTYKTKKKSLHANILGYKSVTAGAFTGDAGVNLGKLHDTWYIDIDTSFLFGLVTVSSRTPLRKKVAFSADVDPESYSSRPDYLFTDNEVEQLQQEPLIQDKEDVARENSLSFQGVDLFFGLFSMQRADTKRHFRMLPLAWFSWDKNSKDKVYFVPGAFLNYQRDDTSYFALFPLFFPLYGKQQKGNSYREGYLLNLFWREYEEKDNYHEYSVLWPIVNWYHSPQKRGSRIFPLYWYATWKDATYEHTRVISPACLWYKNEYHSVSDNGNKYELSINPFLYTHLDVDERHYEKTSWYPIVPLVYTYDSDKEAAVRFLYGLHYRYLDKEHFYRSNNLLFGLVHADERFSNDRYEKEDITEKSSWIIPLYYAHRKKATEEHSSRSTFILAPCFLPLYIHSTQGMSYRKAYLMYGYWEEYDAPTDRYDHAVLWPLIKWYSSPTAHGWSVLPVHWYDYWHEGPYAHSRTVSPFLLWYKHSTVNTRNPLESTEVNLHLLRGKYAVRNGDTYRSYQWYPLLPLVYNYNSDQESALLFMGGLHYRYQNNRRCYQSNNLLFGLVHSDTTYRDATFDKDQVRGRRFWIFPLYYANRTESSGNGRKATSNVLVAPLGIPLYRSMQYGEAYAKAYLLNLYWREHDPYNEREEYTILWPLINYYKVKNSYGWRIFPLFWYKNSSSGRTQERSYATLLSYHASSRYFDEKGDNNTFATFSVNPLWWYSNSSHGHADYEEGSFSLPLTLGLVSHSWGKSSTDWLFGPVRYKNNEETGESLFHILPLVYRHKYDDAKTTFVAGYYSHTSRGYSRTNFLYLWDRKITGTGNDADALYRYLFGIGSYQSNREFYRFKAAYGLLCDYKNYRDENKYAFNAMLLFIQSRDHDRFHSSFIPFWWHTHDNYKSLTVIPPLLSYDYRDENSIHQLWALGALWYRNCNKIEERDRKLLLLGLLYNEKKMPERDYSSKGSVWGLLWEYEKENDSYSKFSLLKFLYKRVRNENKVYHKVCGVTVSKKDI